MAWIIIGSRSLIHACLYSLPLPPLCLQFYWQKTVIGSLERKRNGLSWNGCLSKWRGTFPPFDDHICALFSVQMENISFVHSVVEAPITTRRFECTFMVLNFGVSLPQRERLGWIRCLFFPLENYFMNKKNLLSHFCLCKILEAEEWYLSGWHVVQCWTPSTAFG